MKGGRGWGRGELQHQLREKKKIHTKSLGSFKGEEEQPERFCTTEKKKIADRPTRNRHAQGLECADPLNIRPYTSEVPRFYGGEKYYPRGQGNGIVGEKVFIEMQRGPIVGTEKTAEKPKPLSIQTRPK